MRKLLVAFLIVLFVGCAGTTGVKKSVETPPPPEPSHTGVLETARLERAKTSIDNWLATEIPIFEMYMSEQAKSKFTVVVGDISFVNDYQAAIIYIEGHCKVGIFSIYLIATKMGNSWEGKTVVIDSVRRHAPVGTEAQNPDEKF